MNYAQFRTWLKGNSKHEHYENTAIAMIVGSAVLVGIGVLVGSFVPYVVYLGSIGGMLLLGGIALYIVSQMMDKKENVPASA